MREGDLNLNDKGYKYYEYELEFYYDMSRQGYIYNMNLRVMSCLCYESRMREGTNEAHYGRFGSR